MPSLLGKVARFARTPQGREMTHKAMRFARSPEGKRKIQSVRSQLASRRAAKR